MKTQPWYDVERVSQPGSTVLTAWRAAREQQRHAAVQTPARRAPTRLVRRSFNGAAVNNLTSSFNGDHVSLNEDLERSLRILRSRSRQLAKNNDYVKKFLRMVQNHVVGPNGFTLSVPCLRDNGSIDEADKLVCEKAFAKWAKRGVCDVTGRLSFVQLQRLLILMCARDGEAIVRRVRDRSVNSFGYALQVIDPVLLDDTYRADFPDGRRIRMGVEVSAVGKPLAYHFLQDVEYSFGGGGRRVRVPAEEVWHLFLQEEPNQVRGVPWIHTAMRSLNDLGGYVEAAVIAARVGASNMGFYIPPDDQASNAGALADEVINNDDGSAELVKDAAPGTFEELPPGYDFKQFNPDYPHQNFDVFVKAMLRGISSGMGADYNTLANDLEGVNYSSIRSGKLETQDEWMCLQGWFREGLHEPLWPEWLSFGFVSGELKLPISKFEKYNVAVWQGRRWRWVDPLKDMQATKLELDSCLTSYSAVMREMGRDPEATWRELAKDKERIKDLLPKPVATPAPAGVAASEPEKEKPDEE
jgi:lambda family phage portal protein